MSKLGDIARSLDKPRAQRSKAEQKRLEAWVAHVETAMADIGIQRACGLLRRNGRSGGAASERLVRRDSVPTPDIDITRRIDACITARIAELKKPVCR